MPIMLRTQLALAVCVLSILLGLATVALHRLIDAMSELPAIALPVAFSFLAVRLIAPFRQPQQAALPRRTLDRCLALLQGIAIVRMLVPAQALAWLPDTATPTQWLGLILPVLLALFAELALVACLQIMAPTIQAALAADMAVAQWFAQRRVLLEQELLDSMSRSEAANASFRHRLASLASRFERQVTHVAARAEVA
jgi:hypothetical protein